ncbi:hypothetical protein ABW20_dc0106220 [Dactylellina cionopaga]|nr:hypothetical protein ABW20_dc0106220 [Dactylellina cionopaga]
MDDDKLQTTLRIDNLRPRIKLVDLPDEILLTIADYLDINPRSDCKGSLNSIAQTCRRLRNVAYPLVNRHLLCDEETQHPDVIINMVLYSFTEPLVEFVRAATFRLLSENDFCLGDEYDGAIAEFLPVIRQYLKEKAADGDEVCEFFEGQIEEYGMATLPTILMYQLRGLKELELACSITALSSRFMLTTLHHFDPPFKLDQLSMPRLVDLEPANYWLLERFLRVGVRRLGIDTRYGSTNGGPKVRPPSTTPPEEIFEFYDSDGDDSLDYDDNLSESSIEEELKVLLEYRGVTEQRPHGRDVQEEIALFYGGYEPLDHNVSGYGFPIDYNPFSVDPESEATMDENSNEWCVHEMRLWYDYDPSVHDALLALVKKVRALRKLDDGMVRFKSTI